MMNALVFYRFARALHEHGLTLTARAVTTASRLLFSAHIPPEAKIGPGGELGYGGIGIIIHKDAVIGRDVLISPGVVIGGRSGLLGVPKIGNHVKIGSGAKVLGPVTIGDHASIGANAVVLRDVEAGDTVAGVPARSLHPRKLQTVAT